MTTRAALLNYCLQNLRIERESPDTPPEVQQITLLNREAVAQWLFDSRQATQANQTSVRSPVS